MLIVAVDVGIVNLGLVQIRAKAPGQYELLLAERVDIREFRCGAGCSLHHARMAADWVSHLLAEYRQAMESADVVLVERQPPGGHRDVEQLIVAALRSKVRLVHPRSVHSFLGLRGFDYAERKVASVNRARKLFANAGPVALALRCERAHDVADAAVMAHYYCCRVARHWTGGRADAPPVKVPGRATGHFERFRYARRPRGA